MARISIVIITKNEADILPDCISMAKLITDDIVIVDSGSTDGTLAIAGANDCSVYQFKWEGYGANKNKGIELARYDWILSIDADEVPDVDLINCLHELQLGDENVVYDIKFKSYLGKKQIRFGQWGRDHHLRLFNRRVVKWSSSRVHETLILPKGIVIKKINGHLHHYSVKDLRECKLKAVYYAKLSAESLFQSGKKATFVKLYLSPVFSFFIGYFIYLGFLDGKEGWQISMITYKNKYLKYRYLKNTVPGYKKEQPVKINLPLNIDEIPASAC